MNAQEVECTTCNRLISYDSRHVCQQCGENTCDRCIVTEPEAFVCRPCHNSCCDEGPCTVIEHDPENLRASEIALLIQRVPDPFSGVRLIVGRDRFLVSGTAAAHFAAGMLAALIMKEAEDTYGTDDPGRDAAEQVGD